MICFHNYADRLHFYFTLSAWSWSSSALLMFKLREQHYLKVNFITAHVLRPAMTKFPLVQAKCKKYKVHDNFSANLFWTSTVTSTATSPGNASELFALVTEEHCLMSVLLTEELLPLIKFLLIKVALYSLIAVILLIRAFNLWRNS